MNDIDAWVWWLIGAAGLGIPLVVTAMPEFGMLAVGAVAAAIAAGIGFDAVAQVLVFVVVSVALIAVVRPIAARHSAQRPQLATGVDALKGKQAVVLERVDGAGGRIKLAGEIWSARALDTDRAYEVGEAVDVVEIEGSDRDRHLTSPNSRTAQVNRTPHEPYDGLSHSTSKIFDIP